MDDSNRPGQLHMSGVFLGMPRNTPNHFTPFQEEFGRSFYMHSSYMTLVNLQEKF